MDIGTNLDFYEFQSNKESFLCEWFLRWKHRGNDTKHDYVKQINDFFKIVEMSMNEQIAHAF